FLVLPVVSMFRLSRRSTLFPYTTLFRSMLDLAIRVGIVARPFPIAADDIACIQLQAAGHRLGQIRPAAERIALIAVLVQPLADIDRKSTRLNSSHVKISYAVFCLKKKK